MTGILLLFVAVLWLFIAFWLIKIITTKLPDNWWGIPIRVVLFFTLLPLPLIDEIVGGRQFEQLCKDNSAIQVDRTTAAGKTVYLADLPNIPVKGTWVPISLQPWRYVDVTTGVPVVSFNIVQASGGRFIRTLGISEGGVPLTFEGYCAPGGSRSSVSHIFKELGITQIQRSTLKEQK